MSKKTIIELILLISIVTLGAGCLSDGNDRVKLDDHHVLYNLTVQTETGNMTIQSPLPIETLSENESKALPLMKLKPLTWYGQEIVTPKQQDIYVLSILVDKPLVAGDLPDYSYLNNITVIHPSGNVSRASEFKAWKSTDGKSLLSFKSSNFYAIIFFKTDQVANTHYIINGTSVPLEDYVYHDKSVVSLVFFI
jgi:hypothetical protein